MPTKIENFPPKSDMILELQRKKNSIHHKVIELIAAKSKSNVKGKQRLAVLESLNDKALKEIYATFKLNKSDSTGKHFEYRCLNYYLTSFLKKKGKEAQEQLTNIDMHRTLFMKSGGNKNFDFMIEYNNGQLIDLIECKERKKEADLEIVHEFLENCKSIDRAEHNEADVDNVFLFSKSGFTPRAIAAVKEKGGSDGEYMHVKTKINFFQVRKDWINIYLIAELNNKLTQIYPSLR